MRDGEEEEDEDELSLGHAALPCTSEDVQLGGFISEAGHALVSR